MKKILLVLALALVAIPAASLGVARLLLPATSCSVTEAQIDSLVLSKMSYDDVTRSFGCAGALKSREDYGKLVIDIYAWRGVAWPFGEFEGTFMNGHLEGTSKTWLNLQLSASKART